MFINGLGTAVPTGRYSQRECWEALEHSPEAARLSPRSRALLRKVLTSREAANSFRHLALDNLQEAFQLNPDVLHERFRRHAPRLASQAARKALAEADSETGAVDAILISTCTGYLCPGLTSYVAEDLGLRTGVLTLDLVGQGCGAALPNLRAAEALLRSGQCERVLCVCVEVCSAAFFLDEDPGVLISACLFADGAAAAVVSGKPGGMRRSVQWQGAESVLAPERRELLRLEQKGGMLRNLLSPSVPQVAAGEAAALARRTLAAHGLGLESVRGWILHPGGREVLAALRREFGLPADQVRWSAEVLQEYGNLSSPSVLFVLEAALRDSGPDGLWWMSAFGAGFSCHGAMLQVTG